MSNRFQPGQSGNRAGRPRGFAGIARKIMEATDDGTELIEFALRVLRDPQAPLREKIQCLQWLGDRSMGRPLQSVDLTASITEDTTWIPPAGWTAMPVSARRSYLRDLRARALAGAVIDVDSDDETEGSDHEET